MEDLGVFYAHLVNVHILPPFGDSDFLNLQLQGQRCSRLERF
jgi:hypothetical protein